MQGGDMEIETMPFQRSVAGCITGALAIGVLAWTPNVLAQGSAPPKSVTLCTAIDLCYCVSSDYRDKIDANIARVRQLIADNRKQGRAVGYLSVPVSPAGGGYAPYNIKAAGDMAADVETRFGKRAVFVLNPAAEASKEME